MQTWARGHVRGLTVGLSAVSLALVFGAALQVVPTTGLGLPAWMLGAIPHVNAVVSTAAIGTIVAGVWFARRGMYRRHRAMMLLSMGLFVVFLGLSSYSERIPPFTAGVNRVTPLRKPPSIADGIFNVNPSH